MQKSLFLLLSLLAVSCGSNKNNSGDQPGSGAALNDPEARCNYAWDEYVRKTPAGMIVSYKKTTRFEGIGLPEQSSTLEYRILASSNTGVALEYVEQNKTSSSFQARADFINECLNPAMAAANKPKLPIGASIVAEGNREISVTAGSFKTHFVKSVFEFAGAKSESETDTIIDGGYPFVVRSVTRNELSRGEIRYVMENTQEMTRFVRP